MLPLPADEIHLWRARLTPSADGGPQNVIKPGAKDRAGDTGGRNNE